jgi:type I restriction-modification system DNA methylase subunit
LSVYGLNRPPTLETEAKKQMSSTVQTEIDKAKSRGKDRVKQTAEVFTPMDLCLQMVRDIPREKLIDPNTRYLDNSCGDGNFLVTLLQVLTEDYGHDRNQVLDNQLYGVDLMPDNIAEVKRRLGVPEDHPHFVCHDGLTYDYSFGENTEK